MIDPNEHSEYAYTALERLYHQELRSQDQQRKIAELQRVILDQSRILENISKFNQYQTKIIEQIYQHLINLQQQIHRLEKANETTTGTAKITAIRRELRD